jgi:GT2 family glycosyltransferase
MMKTAPASLAADSSRPAATADCDQDRAESLSVVICSYTTARWGDLCRAAESVLSQDGPTPEVILVIDHCDELYVRACNRFGTDERVTVQRNTEAPGLSGARNTGIAATRGDVIAFIDDDADAEVGWIPTLMRHFRDSRVACVGGFAVPIWTDGRPSWMPEEFDWVVGCSYVGQPTRLAPVRNPIGCNMSMRRSVLDVVGGFRSEVGRIGSTPAGCEETELCIRIRSNRSSNQILFDPEIRVRHHVSPERGTLRYFVRRCHYEGVSKAIVRELANVPEALSSERAYTVRVIPRGVLREISSMSSDGFARAAVMVLGLAVTSAGYTRARVSRLLRRGR